MDTHANGSVQQIEGSASANLEPSSGPDDTPIKGDHFEELYYSAGELSPTASEAYASDRSPTASEAFDPATPSAKAMLRSGLEPDLVEEESEGEGLVTQNLTIGGASPLPTKSDCGDDGGLASVVVAPRDTPPSKSLSEAELVDVDLGSGTFDKVGFHNAEEEKEEAAMSQEAMPGTLGDGGTALPKQEVFPAPPPLEISTPLESGSKGAEDTAAADEVPVEQHHPFPTLAPIHAKRSTEGIPFHVVIDGVKKPATLSDSYGTIDFNHPGLAISSFDFVGLRYVQPGSSQSSSGHVTSLLQTINTAGHKLTDMLAESARTVEKVFSAMPSPKTRLRKPSIKAVTPSATPHRASQQKELQNGVQEDPSRPRRHSCPGDVTISDAVHWWEILWKDHNRHNQNNPTGSLRRLQFETTMAGYELIRDRIRHWSSVALGNAGMTEAAQAALEAKATSPTAGTPKSTDKNNWQLPVPSLTAAHLFTKQRRWSSTVSGPAGHRTEKAVVSSDSNGSQDAQNPAVHSSTPSSAKSAEADDVSSPCRSEEGVTLSLVAGPSGSNYQHGYQHVIVPIEEAKEPASPGVAKPGLPMVEGKFLPNMNPHSHLLQQPHIRALAACLPTRFRLSAWNLTYSTWRDGISLQTLYRKCFKKGPSLVIVSDRKHNVFGCFASEDWKVHPRYYGTGESFVFTLYPEMRVFRWTRNNSYFMFGTPDSIHMGGGSHFALSLDGDLMHGSSGSCETFGNDNSLAGTEEFEILHVEVWGFK